ncbi:MAG: hypothetical protein GWP10_07385 [Nitrospiraceae bacterium]|nr:hypothetical protein [Nitrospiraceae bacterium]
MATLSVGNNQYETDKRKIFVYPTATIQFLLQEKSTKQQEEREDKILKKKLLDILVALSYKLYYVTLSQKVSTILKEISSSKLTENNQIELIKQIVKLRQNLLKTDADVFYMDPISPNQIERYHFWNLMFKELRIKEIRNLVLEQINLIGSTIQELLRGREEKQREELKLTIQKGNRKLLESIEKLTNENNNFIGKIKNLTNENGNILSELRKLTKEYEGKREVETKIQKEEAKRESLRNILLTLIAIILSIAGTNFYTLDKLKEATGIEKSFCLLSNGILLTSTVLLPVLLIFFIYKMLNKSKRKLIFTLVMVFLILYPPVIKYYVQIVTNKEIILPYKKITPSINKLKCLIMSFLHSEKNKF